MVFSHYLCKIDLCYSQSLVIYSFLQISILNYTTRFIIRPITIDPYYSNFSIFLVFFIREYYCIKTN